MSIIYFLAPYERQKWIDANNLHQNDWLSDLRIDPVDYANALSERWPLIKFLHNIEPSTSRFALTWELHENRETFVGLRGNLYQNLQIVSFSRTLKETFVSFVLWHRFFVPSAYSLFLFDSGSSQSLEITTNSTEHIIGTFVGYTD